jgi:hypothetical protein
MVFLPSQIFMYYTLRGIEESLFLCTKYKQDFMENQIKKNLSR